MGEEMHAVVQSALADLPKRRRPAAKRSRRWCGALPSRFMSFPPIGASNLGDAGSFTYRGSRSGNAESHQVVEQLLPNSGLTHRVIDFGPYGYDEQQYFSPAFDLPSVH